MDQSYYIGIDFHKRYSHVTVIDNSGSIVKKNRLEDHEPDIRGFIRIRQWVKFTRYNFVRPVNTLLSR